MQSILQSGFLQVLAYALLSSIWQMGLLWLLVIFLLRILKLSSSQKFIIAFTAQATGFLIFIYSLFNNDRSALNIFKNADTNYINNAIYYLKIAMPLTAIIYLIVLIWHILKLFYTYRFTQNLRNNNLVKMPAERRIFLQELVTMFSMQKRVNIYLSKIIKCPLTIGFFKPVILIPLAAINYLTKEQMEAVILHELAHIKRADYLLNFLQCIIEKIFFFNIFSKMLNDIIERERENACDDWVIQFKYNSFHYAEALLKLGKLQALASFAMASSGKKQNLLFYRVKRLIQHSGNNDQYKYSSIRFSFFALIIALGLICTFSSRTSGLITNPDVHSSVVLTRKINSKNLQKNHTSFQVKFIEKKRVENTGTKKNFFSSKTVAKPITATSYKSHKIEQGVLGVTPKINPDYAINITQSIDSSKQPSYSNALNKQLLLNKDVYKKALSYQNFKQLEAMLELTGNSVKVTEDPDSKDNYKKLITIETTDKNGDKNVYQVIVELYQ